MSIKNTRDKRWLVVSMCVYVYCVSVAVTHVHIKFTPLLFCWLINYKGVLEMVQKIQGKKKPSNLCLFSWWFFLTYFFSSFFLTYISNQSGAGNQGAYSLMLHITMEHVLTQTRIRKDTLSHNHWKAMIRGLFLMLRRRKVSIYPYYRYIRHKELQGTHTHGLYNNEMVCYPRLTEKLW